MSRGIVISGVVGVCVGLAIGLILSDNQREPRSAHERETPAMRSDSGPRQTALVRGASAKTNTLVGESPADSVPRRKSDVVRGTFPVVVRSDRDKPFVKFAEAILPTLEQVRLLAAMPPEQYAAHQLEAHLAALRSILGDRFDAAKEYEAQHFIKAWAYKKHRYHEEYARKADVVLQLPEGPERARGLSRIGREWALRYAQQKLKKIGWINDTFTGAEYVPRYSGAFRRLGRYAEAAAAIRSVE